MADHARQVATSTELHHYEKPGTVFINHAVVVARNIWVPQLPQNINFGDEELLLAFAHRPIVNLLPDERFVIGNAPDLMHLAEAALTNLLNDLVLVAN